MNIYFGAGYHKRFYDKLRSGWSEFTDLYEDLIKNTITASFGRGQDNQVSELIKVCEDNGFAYNKKEKVEPMTLKAFVREQIEEGKKIPFDLFGVYIANKTKITNK